MAELVASVTEASFEDDVLMSHRPVLVDFWAPWCGPCRQLAPILEEVAAEYAEVIKVVKLNLDEHREMGRKFAIRSIPTLLLFKDGEVVATHVGSASKEQLMTTLREAIEKNRAG